MEVALIQRSVITDVLTYDKSPTVLPPIFLMSLAKVPRTICWNLSQTIPRLGADTLSKFDAMIDPNVIDIS